MWIVQPRTIPPPRSRAFLIAQIGSHAAARFAERLTELDLLPAHAGILRAIAGSAGISQQELALLLAMLPSRLVPFLDVLEERGVLERRNNAGDRRVYALHLTDKGHKLLGEIGRVARAHDEDICASLSLREREELGALLVRIADEQGLTPGVHPGFSRITEKTSTKRDASARSKEERRAKKKNRG